MYSSTDTSMLLGRFCGCDCPCGSCLSPMPNQERTAMFFICLSCFFRAILSLICQFCLQSLPPRFFFPPQGCFFLVAAPLLFRKPQGCRNPSMLPSLQLAASPESAAWKLTIRTNEIDLRAVASCSNLKAMHAASLPYDVVCSNFTSLQKSIPSLNVPVAEFSFW